VGNVSRKIGGPEFWHEIVIEADDCSHPKSCGNSSCYFLPREKLKEEMLDKLDTLDFTSASSFDGSDRATNATTLIDAGSPGKLTAKGLK
jgi:hypothetical protein